MPPAPLSIETTIVVEVLKFLFTVIAGYLGGTIAMRNQRSNHWWDSRKAAYDQILANLTFCASYCREVVVMVLSREDSAPPLPEMEEKQRRFEEAEESLQHFRSLGGYLIHEAAGRVIFETMQVQDADLRQYYLNLAKVYLSAAGKMKIIALRDLHPFHYHRRQIPTYTKKLFTGIKIHLVSLQNWFGNQVSRCWIHMWRFLRRIWFGWDNA